MNKNYVAQYHRLETTHWWFLIRQKIITQVLKKYIPKQKDSLKILNVGAASGASSQCLSSLGEVISVENDPVFLDFLVGKKIPVINASIIALPFDDNSFDLICALDILEHVADDTKAIAELVRVCKPGGKICITVPACRSLWSAHDEVNNHFRRYSKSRLINLIDKQKNKLLYSTYFNTILFPAIFILRKMEKLFRKKDDNEKSDFDYYKTNRWLSDTLKKIFGWEVFLLRFVKFSFGVSLLTLIEKGSNSTPR